MPGDEVSDLLCLFVAMEVLVSLLAAVDLCVLALDGPVQPSLVPHVAVFVGSAVALLVTAAIGDYQEHARRRGTRRHP